MIARFPVWLVHPGEQQPGRHRLNAQPDNERDGPDEGLLLIDLPGGTLKLVPVDSDVRFAWGDLDTHAALQPANDDHEHYTACRNGHCGHVTELPCTWQRTDAGWWLIITLLDGGTVWVHEDDVPIDNHPDRSRPTQRCPFGVGFMRRPADEHLTDTTTSHGRREVL